MRTDRPRRVFIGLGETAGYCTGLARGFDRIGIAAVHANLSGDPFQYDQSMQPRVIRMARWLTLRRRRGGGPLWVLLQRTAMAMLFAWAVLRFDTFVFRAGDSFFALRDLALLRRLNKRVVVVFFGTDSRPSYLNGAEVHTRTAADLVQATQAKRRLVHRTEQAADVIICHTMSAQLHRRRAIAFLAIGIPRTLPASLPPMSDAEGAVRVLHAPSRSAGKGSDVIELAVSEARDAGAQIELETVSGQPTAAVQAALARCDLAVDQAFADTPMGAFASEAAAMGRPVIVGGYGWDELRRVTPSVLVPPTWTCHPDELADSVKQLAADASRRRETGSAAASFIREHWEASEVARRYVRILTGSAPADWWFDPGEVRYVHGAGLGDSELTEAVTDVLKDAGASGLALDHRPDLMNLLFDMAGRTEGAGSEA